MDGRAILYADKITDSMRRAIDETERRRNKQVEFNQAHGIEPQTIRKRVADVMEGAYAHVTATGRKAKRDKVSDVAGRYRFDEQDDPPESPRELAKLIDDLEKQMFEYAKKLEFEQAAAMRDRIDGLRQKLVFSD